MKTSIYDYTPETTRQLLEWSSATSTAPVKVSANLRELFLAAQNDDTVNVVVPFNPADQGLIQKITQALQCSDLFVIEQIANWRALRFAYQPAKDGDFCTVGGIITAAALAQLPEIFTQNNLPLREFLVFPNSESPTEWRNVWIIFTGRLSNPVVQRALTVLETALNDYRFWGNFH